MAEEGFDSDDYRAWNKQKQEKRASNRESSANYLQVRGIHFTEHNNGAHLIVEGKTGFIDFWPGTGKWSDRKGPKGFGVRGLVEHITKD